LGYGLTRNLVQSGYRGAIHLVNIKGGSLHGRPLYRSLADVPEPADLAVLLIPAAFIPQALLDCAGRGLHAAIIASGGFRETGEQGAALEAQCLQIARQHAIRLLGPNCIGIIDTHLPIDTTFLSPPGPTPGDVAFISHSGAICAAVIDWARGQGFGISLLVSLGNQADVNETDVLLPVAADEHTHVLTLYLEGVSNGRRFVEQASKVARLKPILALKVGRYAGGQRAVASHTGALAGKESAFNAAFRRAGVIRASTSEELFDWARALAWCPLPQGRNVAILTNAGGPGVTAADAVEGVGLSLARLSQETQAALRAVLEPAASVQNPVDMLAAASPPDYANCLRILLNDSEVHSVMVVLPPPPMHTAGGIAKAIIPVIYTAEKPVVISLMGERLIQEAVEYFRAAHIPEYRFPERAAAALSVLAQRVEALARSVTQEPRAPALEGLHPDRVNAILAELAEKSLPPSGFLPAETTVQILAAYGIAAPSAHQVHSPAEAGERAAEVGFPVVLKVISPDLVHKSDAGGVLLDLPDREAVQEGYQELVAAVRRRRPEAQITGVEVQRMVPEGQEVIVGALQDAQFGPLVMFGSGGTDVEGLKDVEFSLAPLYPEEAERLLTATWAGRKLQGFRNLPPADRQAALEVLYRLGQLASDFPQFAEIEINPLRVLPAGQGALALDARLRLAG
jgi:acetyltransferase